MDSNRSAPLEVDSSLQNLFEGLLRSHAEIIEEWSVLRVENLQRHPLDQARLLRHIAEVIAEITHALANPPEEFFLDKPEGSAWKHGAALFHEGLDFGEVVVEYHCLRLAFFTIAERNNRGVIGDAARILNTRLDAALQQAIRAFAAEQTAKRDGNEKEHLALIAHDLRTPLNTAGLLTAELKDILEEKQIEWASDIFEVLERNLACIEGLIKKLLEENAEPEGLQFLPERNQTHPGSV